MINGLAFTFLGVAIGSFLNVCIDRLPVGKSILHPPSACDSCGQRLGFADLIPIVSFLIARGKCRYCKSRVPVRNLMVEVATGLAFGLAWLRHPDTIWSLLFAGYSAVLILILAIDLEHHRILNKVTYPAVLFALLATPLMPGQLWWEYLIGGALGFGSLFLLAVFFPAGMGMGDVKLGAFIGLVVGFPNILLALFLSFVLGGLMSGILVLTRRIGRRDPIAFAPYLGIAAITTMLYGEQILIWWAGRI